MARTLNLGILAHVDAGKTTLTERLLHAAGVIDEPGSVDEGTTRTDFLALERERGITIKAAVVSFAVAGRGGESVKVNLIDTPGHPDFIAEVERALAVLDGAVLVVSAVEGVQAQTRVLMRALRRLGLPTLIFVNKIDRAGARHEPVLEALGHLAPAAVAMGAPRHLGTRDATFAPYGAGHARFVDALADALASNDDRLLADYVADGGTVPYRRLRRALAAQARRALVQPVFFGSAITGAGVAELVDGIATLLPAAPVRADGGGDPPSGAVFKVERGAAGERVAYVRMFAGVLRTRERVRVGGRPPVTVTAIRVFDGGTDLPRPCVGAGEIAKVWGLGAVRIGDVVGGPGGRGRDDAGHQFAPPTLETVVTARRASDRGALRVALDQLAEQDPLIDVRQDDVRGELHVSLYGEVQKEVVEATLAAEYGIEVDFRASTTICVERPAGRGAAVEVIRTPSNPILATVGLRVDPAPVGAGVTFGLEVEYGSIPLSFHKAVEETVFATLGQGLHGWQVVDCVVTMTHSGYYPRQSHAHQGFSRSMSSTAADFRNLTPLVLMTALRRAGTVVCEPIHRFHLEFPAAELGRLLPVLAAVGATPGAPTFRGTVCLLDGDVPAARLHELQQALPGLTHGEGILESRFGCYRPVRGAGPPPARPRTDNNPLDRDEYLLRVLRRAPQRGGTVGR